MVAFYSGIKVKPTPYASDYKMKLDDDMDIDIPTVRKFSIVPLSSVHDMHCAL